MAFRAVGGMKSRAALEQARHPCWDALHSGPLTSCIAAHGLGGGRGGCGGAGEGGGGEGGLGGGEHAAPVTLQRAGNTGRHFEQGGQAASTPHKRQALEPAMRSTGRGGTAEQLGEGRWWAAVRSALLVGRRTPLAVQTAMAAGHLPPRRGGPLRPAHRPPTVGVRRRARAWCTRRTRFGRSGWRTWPRRRCRRAARLPACRLPLGCTRTAQSTARQRLACRCLHPQTPATMGFDIGYLYIRGAA